MTTTWILRTDAESSASLSAVCCHTKSRVYFFNQMFLKCVIGDTQVDIIMNLEMKNGFFYQHVTELSGGQFTFNQLKGDFLKLEVNLL